MISTRFSEASCGDMLKMQMVREEGKQRNFLLRPLKAGSFYLCQAQYLGGAASSRIYGKNGENFEGELWW